MPVNLNPPPLPTPDTARSAQPPMPLDDDPVAADLFAQLVAAAALSNAPLVAATSGELKSSDDASGKTEAPRTDAIPIDWALAFGGTPVAVPVALLPEHTRAPLTHEDTVSRVRAGAPSPRVERHAPRVVELDAAHAAKREEIVERRESRPLANDLTLRDQLAAALAPRSSAQAPQPAAVPVADDARARDATPAARPASAPCAMPFAAALAVAVEHERTSEHAPHEPTPTLDAQAAPAPSSSSIASDALAPAPATIAIDTKVGAPGFGEEVATKLAHVVVRHDRAELRLSPAELGPVDIRIDMRSDSASLTIVAAHPATRDALEQALPQLRESLAAQGIALGQAFIHDGRAQSERHSGEPDVSSPRAPAVDDAAAPVLAAGHIRLSDRLVDTFA